MTEERIVNLLELENFSCNFADKILTSEVILIKGDLGAGKTTLIRLLIRNIFFLKNERPPKIIPSPSFPILQSYDLKDFIIHHYDFYRVNEIKEIAEVGFEENIQGNITFIEWPEVILPIISSYRFRTIELSILYNNKRKLIVY